MNDLEKALNKLKETESITLSDIQRMSMLDRDGLLNVIEKWCIYADGNTTKLSSVIEC